MAPFQIRKLVEAQQNKHVQDLALGVGPLVTSVACSPEDGEEAEFPYPIADDKLLGEFLGIWHRGLVTALGCKSKQHTSTSCSRKQSIDQWVISNVLASFLASVCVSGLLVFRCFLLNYKKAMMIGSSFQDISVRLSRDLRSNLARHPCSAIPPTHLNKMRYPLTLSFLAEPPSRPRYRNFISAV